MNFSHNWSEKYFKKKKKKKCFENHNTYLFILGFGRGTEGGVVNLFPSFSLMKCVAELLWFLADSKGGKFVAKKMLLKCTDEYF